MKNELSHPEVKEITIKELSKTLKNLSLTLDNENLEVLQIAAYIIDRNLQGFISLHDRKKLEIKEFINNL
jgi:hypothetical protein